MTQDVFDNLTEEEIYYLDTCLKKFRELEKAKAKYKRDVGMEACCSKKALTGSCLCWQDSWC